MEQQWALLQMFSIGLGVATSGDFRINNELFIINLSSVGRAGQSLIPCLYKYLEVGRKHNCTMNDWKLIVNQAQKLLDTESKWKSLGEQVVYGINYIDTDRISICRLSGGDDIILSKKSAATALRKLKNAQCMKRRDLISITARQTALVYFHPFIIWDPITKDICWSPTPTEKPDFNQIVDDIPDDQLTKIEALIKIRLRKYQSKFRKNLLKLYNNKCAISGISVNQVLQAAHAAPHATHGINKIENGILLRSDLHLLFDNGLLKIHPNTYEIYLDEELHNSEYVKYHGKKISKRTNGTQISTEYLIKRWEHKK